MTTPKDNVNNPHRTHTVGMIGAGDTAHQLGNGDDEEAWWRINYASRPYITGGRDFDYNRPGYRYGFESARKYNGRSWDEVESTLRSEWDTFEHKSKAAWEDINDTVKDSWDHLTSDEHKRHAR